LATFYRLTCHYAAPNESVALPSLIMDVVAVGGLSVVAPFAVRHAHALDGIGARQGAG
jgi:hypothetical protein